MRRRGLSVSQRAEVLAPRNQGWSLSKIGARFRVNPSTVRNYLLLNGKDEVRAISGSSEKRHLQRLRPVPNQRRAASTT
jgi:hypothetical protein